MHREPLVHFLVIGAALFFLFDWAGGRGGGERRIVITRGQIDHLKESFNVVWLRPPTEEEFKELLDDYVREDLAIREAMRMGLDRDDSVIRQRLRQKFEFTVEDSLDTHPPTDEDLKLWLDKHPEAFRGEPRISFRQVYVSRERRGAKAEELAKRLLAGLTPAGADASIESLGDPLTLPREVPLSSRSDVARRFGEEFTARLVGLEPGRWQGPIESGFGLHLVFVRERVDGRLPPLSEIRDAVEREFQAARSQAELDATYERLLSEYTVVIEKEASTIQ